MFHVVNDPITRQTASLDRSLETFKLCAYRSIELTKREKVLERKNLILSFLKNEREEETHNTFESFHRSNLLTSEIEEWLRHTEECVDEH